MSSMSSFKRSQRKYVKKTYRVRNWREYEVGLRDRGSLTVWIALTDGKLANWDAVGSQNSIRASRVQIPTAKGIARPTNLDSVVPVHRIMQSRRRGPESRPYLVGRL
jgi:hypothetical protein